MANLEQTQKAAQPHKLTLDERCRLSLTGVTEVVSFDEHAIVLATTQGTLLVQGSGLHLQMLSPDGGQVRVDGQVDRLGYEAAGPSGGFFARLFG